MCALSHNTIIRKKTKLNIIMYEIAPYIMGDIEHLENNGLDMLGRGMYGRALVLRKNRTIRSA